MERIIKMEEFINDLDFDHANWRACHRICTTSYCSLHCPIRKNCPERIPSQTGHISDYIKQEIKKYKTNIWKSL